jgi:alanine racemase
MRKTRKKRNSESIPPDDNDIQAEIDTRAIRHNLHFFTKKSGTEIMPVLKANAYGHGMVPVAAFLRKEGVRYLGVATLGEAILLRNSGDNGRILAWLYNIHGQEIKDALQLDLDIALFDDTHLPILTRMIPKGTTVRIHVFVDTGINRAGIPYERAWECCHQIAADPRFELVGLMSHLVCPNKKNNRVVHRQLQMFRDMRDRLALVGIKPPLIHIANTDACIHYDVSDFTLARVGYGMYGLSDHPMTQLAMSVTVPIIQIKEIQKGDGVGYDWEFVAPRRMMIAILPIGYADFIPRSIHMNVYIKGTKRKVLGRLSMDQIVVEARPGDRIGDTVYIFGNRRNCPQTVFDLLSTPIEFLSHIGDRIHRVYAK